MIKRKLFSELYAHLSKNEIRMIVGHWQACGVRAALNLNYKSNGGKHFVSLCGRIFLTL